MSFCTTEKILDDTISHLQDQSATMRAKLLIWLNNTMQDVAGAKQKKPWLWLQKDVLDNTISGNAIAKPADFKYLFSLKSGSDWLLETKHYLTEIEIFNSTDTSATDPTPIGYDLTATEIVLYPGASGTCDLKYIQEVPEYSDSTDNTIFPLHMKNALIYGTLLAYFDYDEDIRAAKAEGKYGYFLSKAMKEDNVQQRKRMPNNPRGYIRTSP